MKNWQESRNYRRIKDENGAVIANIITINGVDVEVSEEVFLAYSQSDRRERYITEELEPGKILSLDKLLEDEVPLSKFGIEQEPSVESILLSQEGEQERTSQKTRLANALSKLDEDEKSLMDVVTLSRLLGHANPSITMDKYGHALDDHKRSSIGKLGGLYAGAKKTPSPKRGQER